MKVFIELSAFSLLLSTCLAITIPKPILIRLCETARLARGLNLKNDEVISSMSAILNDYTHKRGLSPRRECESTMDIDNDGVIQVGVLLELLSIMSNLLQPLRPTSSTLEYLVNHSPTAQLSTLNSSALHNFLDVSSDKFYNLFKPSQSNGTIDENKFVFGSDLVSTVASNAVSSITFDYCKNIDFPESVDIENQIEVQKVMLKIISSVLKTT